MKRPLRLERGDAIGCLILIAVSLLLFGIPTVLGHTPVNGDNLIQNFPLRVLTGKILASGHLPEWNTLSFSGTPLLGSLNAGSFYPLTIIFAVLPGVLAWFINLATCYIAAGLGLYALVRWLGMRPVAAFLGAISYTFMGMMLEQMPHLGVIQGQGWIPWVVLAMLVVTRRVRTADPSLGAMALVHNVFWPFVGLVVAVGLIFLTGEPRAIAQLEIVGSVVFVYCVLFADRTETARRWLPVGTSLIIATAWGVALSAIQLLPGESFIGLSQRSDLTASFFGSGSLSLNKTILLFVPDFFGGAGLLHQPTYFIDYGLNEVSGYVGLLGLVALVAAFLQLIGSRRPERPAWLGLFVFLAGFGLLLAWGEFTPFVHVMAQIPLLNKTRLQSRNLAIFDLAVAVLLAWFCDRYLEGDAVHASLRGWRRWVTIGPLVATALFVMVALVWPQGLEVQLGANVNAAVEGHYLLGWFLVSFGLAVAAIVLLIGGLRLSRDRRRLFLVCFVVFDTAFFMVGCMSGLVPGYLNPEPSPSYAGSVLGTSSRYALIDPAFSHFIQTISLGQPNTNVFTQLQSVQGYGSLIGASYGQATGAHNQNYLNPCGLTSGEYRQLRLGTLVVADYELAPIISVPDSSSNSGALPTVSTTPLAPACPNQSPVTTGHVRQFYFGAALKLSSAFFLPRSAEVMGDAKLASSLRVEVVDAQGERQQVPVTITNTRRGWQVAFPTHPQAVGLSISGPVHKVLETSTVTDTSKIIYSLEGSFQDAIDRSSWRLESTSGTLQVFKTTESIQAPVSLVGAGSGSRVNSVTNTLWGSQSDTIHLTTAAQVVRSEAYLPGWRVSVVSVNGGSTRSITVQAHGLIQSIELPAGDWKVVWTYHAPRLMLGMVVTGVASVALLVAVVWELARLRRRRHSLGLGER